MTQNLWRFSVAPAVIFCSMQRVLHLPAVACLFICAYICVGVWWRILCCSGLEYSHPPRMTLVVRVALNSPLGSASSPLLPLVGVLFCWCFSISTSLMVHAIILPFLRSLFSTGLEATVLHVSVYHLFGSLWIIQKSVLHYHTLALLLSHFLSLYLSNHYPPTHLSLSGPHCGVVVVLKYRALFSWCSSQGCVIPSTSISLGQLISGVSFRRCKKDRVFIL